MNRFAFPLAVLFGAIIVSRLVKETALKVLTTEQKGRLIEELSPVRKYGFLAMVTFIFLAYKAQARPSIWMLGVLIYVTLTHHFTSRQIKKLSLPDNYLKADTLSSCIFLAGILVYFYLVLRPA